MSLIKAFTNFFKTFRSSEKIGVSEDSSRVLEINDLKASKVTILG